MRIITGKYKGIRLNSIMDPYLKPIDDRVKEGLFNILSHRLQEAKVCDLFAGSGAIGLEALSRGAESVLFVEKKKEFASIIRKNIEKLKAQDATRLWPGDVLEALPSLHEKGEQFDLVFVDPPYFDRVLSGDANKFKQVRGERKPKWETGKENSQSIEGEALPQYVLKSLDRYPILKPSGIGMIRTFKKHPVNYEGLKNLTQAREVRYGDAILSFFKLKNEEA